MEAVSDAGTIAALWRYPVKSMMGEEINSAEFTPRGLYGDRVYALSDTSSGKIASAKNPSKWPSLFRFRASFLEPPASDRALPAARIMLPGGTTIVSSQPDADDLLSRELGRPVTILSSAPEHAELEEYWPDMEELALKDTVTDEALPSGTFFDLAILHILTTSTIESLRALYPEGRFEVRRFRPNIVVNTGGAEEGFVEGTWIGKELSVGDIRLKITGPCPRCVMTTLPQYDLPKDPGILRTAAQHNQAHVGVYATVVKSGSAAVGDPITVV
jgi:uncharacterized protein